MIDRVDRYIEIESSSPLKPSLLGPVSVIRRGQIAQLIGRGPPYVKPDYIKELRTCPRPSLECGKEIWAAFSDFFSLSFSAYGGRGPNVAWDRIPARATRFRYLRTSPVPANPAVARSRAFFWKKRGRWKMYPWRSMKSFISQETWKPYTGVAKITPSASIISCSMGDAPSLRGQDSSPFPKHRQHPRQSSRCAFQSITYSHATGAFFCRIFRICSAARQVFPLRGLPMRTRTFMDTTWGPLV